MESHDRKAFLVEAGWEAAKEDKMDQKRPAVSDTRNYNCSFLFSPVCLFVFVL